MSHSDDSALNRRSMLQSIGVAGAAVLAGCADQEPTTDTEQLRIVYDTHLHGRPGDPGDAESVGNYFGLAQELLEDAPGHALMTGGGDELHTSVKSSVFEGMHMVDIYNESPLQYTPYGNHEFDLGPEPLRDCVAESEFTWLSANVIDDRTGDVFAAEEGAKRYAIEEIGDVRIGLTGLAPLETAEISSPGEHVIIQDPFEATQDVVADLEAEDVDLVLLLSHLASATAQDVVEAIDGIDVVPGGDHAHQVCDEVLEINDTLLSFVGANMDHLGQLDLELTADGAIDSCQVTHD